MSKLVIASWEEWLQGDDRALFGGGTGRATLLLSFPSLIRRGKTILNSWQSKWGKSGVSGRGENVKIHSHYQHAHNSFVDTQLAQFLQTFPT